MCPLKGYLWEGGHRQNQRPPRWVPAPAPPTSSQSRLEAPRREPTVCSALRNIRSPRRRLETGQGKQGASHLPHTPGVAVGLSPQATRVAKSLFAISLGSGCPPSQTTHSVQLSAHPDSWSGRRRGSGTEASPSSQAMGTWGLARIRPPRPTPAGEARPPADSGARRQPRDAARRGPAGPMPRPARSSP